MSTGQFRYDVAVAYRIHPGKSSNAPPIFAEDKFKLAELCLKSFRASLGGLRVKLWALLNECPPEYEKLFADVWPAEDLVLVRFPGVPPGTTLHEQSRILMDQTDAEIVFLAEDDYFFLPGQFRLAVDFLRQNADADFASPYDHVDLHRTDLHKLRMETREFGGKKWRSALSATHTFLAKRSSLIEIRGLFSQFHSDFKGKTSPDLAMWMSLTKRRVFNPFKFVQWLATGRLYWAGSIYLSWLHCWRQILFGRRYTLWAPNPSIATHMVAGQEAMGIDWQKEFQRQLSAESAGKI